MDSRPTTCSPLLTGTLPAAAKSVPAVDLTATATKKASTNRCPTCQKKLALTDLTCRCGPRYCSVHRLPEAHACTHDFRTDGLKVLATQLERMAGEKLQKI
jgi:predicted nucleic acid binding AN1-type Zn finger protein